MKLSFLLLLVLLALATTAADRPNIIFILVDDLGWADLGCYGSTFHETPHIDQLAGESMRFTDAYAANPVCSPTRASIMTGKYPSRIKMTNHSGIAGPRGPAYKLTAPQPIGSLPLSETTIAEALRDAGYQTAHVGKWHLQTHSQKDKKHFPEAHGFQVNVAGHNAGQPGSFFYPYKHPKHTWSNVPGLEPGKPGEYLTDRLTEEAIRFIDDTRQQPFFLNLWYYSVHTPIQAKADKIAKYRAKAAKLPPLAEEAIREHDSWHHARQDNPTYAAMVESLDENVGRLLTALRDRDLERRTIIMLMSDNGGLSTGTSKGAPTSCLPLRAGKGWVYEGGIRSPLLVKWPGTTTSGSTCEVPVISTDVYPTLLTMAGLPQRPKQHLDGVDLSPLLRRSQTTLNRDALYFHYPHYHHINSMGPSGAIRVGDHKLVERFETMTTELYNVRQDPGEQQDLSKTNPEVATRLRSMLHQWRAQSGADMPARNKGYGEQPSPMPTAAPQTPKIPSPDVANKPLDVHCRAVPGNQSDGVLLAQGGQVHGYAIYVQDTKACFSVRINQALTTITSASPAPNSAFNIRATLAADGAMSLHINDVSVASGSAGSLLTTQPGVQLSLGHDTRAPVGPYGLPFAYPGTLLSATVNGVSLTDEFYTPPEDLDGLKATGPADASLPNVLLIGDSISIAYTPDVTRLLAGTANVQRARGNCGDTKRGLAALGNWLGDTQWDVIHFNWGLHDLCYRHPDAKVYGNRDKINGTIAVPLPQYRQNLQALVEQLKKTGASLIWAATTVVPEGEAGRHPADAPRYNAAAAEVMAQHGIPINDLFAESATFPPKLFTKPGDVHFSKAGTARLATRVANAIKKELSP